MKGNLSSNQYHRSFYITLGIPVGKGKAAQNAEKMKASEIEANNIDKL
jgi:hypothetical protein